MQPQKPKKKVDYEALNSPFMRIPKMPVETSRALIDLGIRELYELQGRSPDVLFEEYLQFNPNAPLFHLAAMRLAVYYIESDNPDPAKLMHQAWM